MNHSGCVLYAELKSVDKFPSQPLTLKYSYAQPTCHERVTFYTNGQFEMPSSHCIACPQCPDNFGMDELCCYMNDEKFGRQANALNDASYIGTGFKR